MGHRWSEQSLRSERSEYNLQLPPGTGTKPGKKARTLMTLVWPIPLYRTLSPALSVWPSAIITVPVIWICHNVDSALSQ